MVTHYNLGMAQPLRFHVLLLPNVGWPELKARVLRLEELGFEVAGFADHLVDWTRPTSPWFELVAVMSAAAEATSTIRIASAVAQIPLRNPALLARQALTIDHISDGRFELGLGTGLTIDPSYEMGGLPNWSNSERVDRFEEYVDLVSRLLAQETTTFEGRFYQVRGAIVNPRPMQLPRPPITVAALGPRMMRLAARYADIWNSASFLPTFDEQLRETRARCDRLDEQCEAVGRDPATLRRSYTMFDAQARPRGGSIAYYESREQFHEQVDQVLALGITEVGIYYPLDPAQLPMFESIALDVLPTLRARHMSS